jgi:hypothetical protein
MIVLLIKAAITLVAAGIGTLFSAYLISTREKNPYAIIVIICFLIVLFQGMRFSDFDYPAIFKAMLSSNISSIDPKKGYLVEGIIVDLIGISYVAMGFKPFTTQLLWWISGLVLLVSVVAYSLNDRSISLRDLVLIVAFSRVVDTLFLWAGKFDPFLLSFLILTANKNKKVALVGIVLAGLSHPILAVISTAGVVLVEIAFLGIWFPAAIVAALSAALVDFGLFHYFFPELLNHTGQAWNFRSRLLINAVHWGLITLFSSILVPFLSIQYFKPALRFVANTHTIFLVSWILIVAIISCAVVLDHTRVACLLTIAPLIVFLRSQNSKNNNAAVAPDFSKAFVILLLSRLVIPHIDQRGPSLFLWDHTLVTVWESLPFMRP